MSEEQATVEKPQWLKMAEVPFQSSQIKKRAGSGGRQLSYAETSSYIERLNHIFGGQWDFKIMERWREDDECLVLGCMTANGITHEQIGSQPIKFKKDSQIPVSIGDDWKAAGSDCIKKCASMFGIGLELWGADPDKSAAYVEDAVSNGTSHEQNEPAAKSSLKSPPQSRETPPDPFNSTRVAMAANQLFTPDEIKAAAEKYPKVADAKKADYIKNIEAAIAERKAQYTETMKALDIIFNRPEYTVEGRDQYIKEATDGRVSGWESLKTHQCEAAGVLKYMEEKYRTTA